MIALTGCVANMVNTEQPEESYLSEVTIPPPDEGADIDEMKTAVDDMKDRQRRFFPDDAAVDSIVSNADRALTSAIVQRPESTNVKRHSLAGYLFFGLAVTAGAVLSSEGGNLTAGLALGALAGAGFVWALNNRYRAEASLNYSGIRDSLAPYFRSYNEMAMQRVREDSVLARRARESGMTDSPEKMARDLEFLGQGLSYAGVAYLCIGAAALLWFMFGEWH